MFYDVIITINSCFKGRFSLISHILFNKILITTIIQIKKIKVIMFYYLETTILAYEVIIGNLNNFNPWNIMLIKSKIVSFLNFNIFSNSLKPQHHGKESSCWGGPLTILSFFIKHTPWLNIWGEIMNWMWNIIKK